MKNAKELRKLVESGEINVTELSGEELNALTDEILENFHTESVADTELLDKCNEALEDSEQISGERYSQLVSEVVDAYNESYAEPPKAKRRMLILIAVAIFILACLGGCRVLDFSVEGLGGWEVMGNIPKGQEVTKDGVSIVWYDNTREYDSMEYMLEKENITDLVLLKDLPEDLTFQKVMYIELGKKDLIYFFYDYKGTKVILQIETNRTCDFTKTTFDEIYTALGIDFGCLFNHPSGNTYAYWNYGKDTYVLQVTAVNEEVLKKALYALEIYSGDEE